MVGLVRLHTGVKCKIFEFLIPGLYTFPLGLHILVGLHA